MIFKSKTFQALNKFLSALFLFGSILLHSFNVGAQGVIQLQGDLAVIPELTQRVVDLTNTLTESQVQLLSSKLSTFEAEKGSQIAVLIVETTAPEDISQYSIRVVDKWKLGRAKIDDGVLLVIAKKDRRIRLEVGYGLEGLLNDATSKRIISETISPLFKKGYYFEGINAGTDQIITLVNKESLPENKGQNQSIDQNGILLITFILALFVGGILKTIFGSGLAGIITGIATGSLAWVISQMVGISILAAFIGFIATFIGNVGGPFIWGGGSGFSGGRGGNDNFSGGGGGFGGGGASGDW